MFQNELTYRHDTRYQHKLFVYLSKPSKIRNTWLCILEGFDK
jgi:hypothetical protein